MSKCRICRKESKGSLCDICEEGFNRAYKIAKNTEINLKIGNTYYILKKSNKNKSQVNCIVPVIYLGPSTWIINKWVRTGLDSYRNDKYDFQCKEADKKNILYRSLNEIYYTHEDCYNANKTKFKESMLNSKKAIILSEVKAKLDEIVENSPDLLDDTSIINYLINPTVNEVTFREEQYKQIRNEIKTEIIKNELNQIREEITNKIYDDIKMNLQKSENKFIYNELEKLTNNYIKDIINLVDEYLKNIIS